MELTTNKGEIILIDDIDSDLASGAKWRIGKRGYAVRAQRVNGKYTVYTLHRTIVARMVGRDLEKTEFVDHINLNTLDNRRSNLRIASPAQSVRNRGLNRNNRTGYKGVCLETRSGKYLASITVNGKGKHLGLFSSPVDAAITYNEEAIKYYGEFARLNAIGEAE